MGEERAARLTWLGAWASSITDAPREVLESCTVSELHGKARLSLNLKPVCHLYQHAGPRMH